MICPHCKRSIPEQDVYLMSARCQEDDPGVRRRRRWAMVYMLVFVVALVIFASFSHYIH